MKAKVKFEIRDEQAEKQAELFGREYEPDFQDGEIFIKIEAIEVAYINDAGLIIVYMSHGEYWALEYDNNLWEAIKDHLK